MLKNCDKIMHLRFNFDACPMHSPFGFMQLTHQNLSAHALFDHNSLAKVNTQLLIYRYCMDNCGYPALLVVAHAITTVLETYHMTSTKQKC